MKHQGRLNQTMASLTKAIIIIFLLFLLLQVSLITIDFRHQVHEYIIGDWLINYGAGIIRRGATGTFILPISDFFSQYPPDTVITIIIILHSLLAFGFLVLIDNRRLEIWFLLLIFSPATFLFPFLDPLGGGRKELLFFALLVYWCVYLDKNKYISLTAMAAFSAATITLMLSHEGLVFFYGFFSVAYIYYRSSQNLSIHISEAIILPVIALTTVFTLWIIGPADKLQIDNLCQLLNSRQISEGICERGTHYLDKDAHHAFLSVSSRINRSYLFPISFTLSLIPLVFFITKGHNKIQFTSRHKFALIACIISTIPIYILGFDYGRWIYITSVSIMLVMTPFLSFYSETSKTQHKDNLSWSGLLFVALYSLTWSVPLLGTYMSHGISAGLGWKVIKVLFLWNEV